MKKVDEKTLANAIRVLSMDAVQKANSGHPGMPMGMADIAEVLWRKHLRHNPKNPHFPNRDRFVLSNGHGSLLQYSVLHLTGYDLSLEDLQQFRQLHSKTPGHPELGYTPGIETTTGPLGQGLANAVGMAMAEKQLAHQFNQSGHEIIDHHTYVFLGDGCLMEGISHEVCSLAGTWQLGKLIAFWDDNGISIDGDVKDWFTDDTVKRFEAYGWHVISPVNGHDSDQIHQAIVAAKAEVTRPTLICCQTQIGFGAPNKAGTAHCHGAPLGDAEVQAARAYLHWPYPPFEMPEEIYQAWSAVDAGEKLQKAWEQKIQSYEKAHPELAEELSRRLDGELPEQWYEWVQQGLQEAAGFDKVATRQASQTAIAHFAKILPEMLGGSADLTGSNNTNWKACVPISRAQPYGNYIHYGVREFGMCAIMNGMALYGGLMPFGGTFLVFSDYARNAIRMSAIMQQKVIYVMTHDSIGLGEDGPTHQPIEHLGSLRMIPHLDVWRPCDALETFVAWQSSLERADGPSLLALSRQTLPKMPRTPEQIEKISLGGYVLVARQKPVLNLLATGSEVMLAVQASEKLWAQGISAQVISMPCVELFLSQDEDYQAGVLQEEIPTLVIEAGATHYWPSIIPGVGMVMGIDTYGESAPAADLYQHFGLTVERIVETAQECIEG